MSLSNFFHQIFIDALIQTLYMTIVPSIIATILGLILAVILITTSPYGLKPNKITFNILSFIVNIFRSFPFMVLIFALIPFTRIIVGTSIGETAAIVPITIGATPFIARIIENSLKEVDKSVVEAAKSFGATKRQIIFKVILKEAMPSIISGITLAVIYILGYTAMAGAVGAGGFGNVALVYGYQQFDTNIIIYTVISLIVIVSIIQALGSYIHRKIS